MYSAQSFYDVVKPELFNHEFLNEEFDKNLNSIVNSFNVDEVHFTRFPMGRGKSILMPTTAFGEFIDILEFIVRDFTEKRGEELFPIAVKLGLLFMKDKLDETF